MDNQNLQEMLGTYMPLFISLIIWELVWKLIALWKAGRNNQLGWFICIALINTAGVLPIIYILLQRKRSSGTN